MSLPIFPVLCLLYEIKFWPLLTSSCTPMNRQVPRGCCQFRPSKFSPNIYEILSHAWLQVQQRQSSNLISHAVVSMESPTFGHSSAKESSFVDVAGYLGHSSGEQSPDLIDLDDNQLDPLCPIYCSNCKGAVDGMVFLRICGCVGAFTLFHSRYINRTKHR